VAGTEFITARFPEAEMSRVQTRAEARERVHGFVRPGEKARIREAGGKDDFGPWLAEREAVGRLDNRMGQMGVGPKLIVQRQNDNDQLSIREVELEPKIPDLGCAPALEEIHAGLWDEFKGKLRSAGRWLCRFIDGTRSVSKHGFLSDKWHGAAEDIFPENQQGLVDVAKFTIAKTKAGVWKAETVIWLTRIWTPGGGERAYTGNPHFHDHIDVAGGHACSP
jgi:hypothetical protein